MLDYEGELAFVIARRCRDVSAKAAPSVIGGWLACNDVSARDWQRQSPTVTMGKSHDGFGPIGPWLVSVDEIDDPHSLRIRTTVNGQLRQDGSTSDMVCSAFEQIAYLSSRCTLEPGDIITTGSPAGSAQALDPPQWLQVGDVIRVEVESIGVLENRVVAGTDSALQ
jgi:2-keto-4-pentenoate hydratase/2-oxohepta-3-ene-1,7-dioic acid hydratase in catechol pathway